MSKPIPLSQNQRNAFLQEAILDDRIPNHIYDHLVEADLYLNRNYLGIHPADHALGDMFQYADVFYEAFTDCVIKAHIQDECPKVRIYMHIGDD